MNSFQCQHREALPRYRFTLLALYAPCHQPDLGALSTHIRKDLPPIIDEGESSFLPLGGPACQTFIGHQPDRLLGWDMNTSCQHPLSVKLAS